MATVQLTCLFTASSVDRASRAQLRATAMVVRILGSLFVLSLLVAQTACTHVAPYERAKIAHPTMTAGELAGAGESHVRAVLEGARGGTVGAESGCGCN